MKTKTQFSIYFLKPKPARIPAGPTNKKTDI